MRNFLHISQNCAISYAILIEIALKVAQVRLKLRQKLRNFRLRTFVIRARKGNPINKFSLTGIWTEIYFSCYAYRNETNVDGNYEGVDDYIMDCPRFANQGCFTADYIVGDITNAYNSSYNKGCSMYNLGEIDNNCVYDPDLGQLCRCK